MINKFLRKYILPQELHFFAAAVLGVAKFAGAKRRDKKVNNAQEEQNRVEGIVAQEQAGRSRRSAIKNATVQQAAIEATSLATGTGGSSGASNAQAGVSGNLATNLGAINTQLATNQILSQTSTNTKNAGKATGFDNFIAAASPFVTSNSKAIDDSIAGLFK